MNIQNGSTGTKSESSKTKMKKKKKKSKTKAKTIKTKCDTCNYCCVSLASTSSSTASTLSISSVPFKTESPNNFSNHARACKEKVAFQSGLIFKGLTFAVTTFQTNKKNMKAGSNYSSICNAIKEIGGTVCGTVHRKVSYVVATQAAIQQNTQKIRKASKHNIKIVDIFYIEKCKSAGKILPLEKFLLKPNSIRKRKRNALSSSEQKQQCDNKEKKMKKIATNSDRNNDDATKSFDLGCCCICHGDDPQVDVVLPCPWCANCK